MLQQHLDLLMQSLAKTAALYIVDWGNVSFTNTGPVTTPNSGVVWKITTTTSS